MKQVLTTRDIDALRLAGERERVIGVDTIVTDLARERAEILGIKLVAAEEKAGLDKAIDQPVDSGEPYDLLINNGRLVIPGLGIIRGNLGVRQGKIATISATGREPARRTVDARNRHLLPGVIDPHVHLGLFQPLATEVASELKSALAGGVTTVGVFLGGTQSHLEAIAAMRDLLTSTSEADVFLHATIANRTQLDELDAYMAQGIMSFKFYLCGLPGMIDEVPDDFLLEGFSRLAARPGTMAMVHAENAAAVKWASARAIAAGVRNLADWSATHPDWSEAEAVARAARFANATGTSLYLVHISSGAGLAAARRAKADYGRVFVETTSPYLTLDTATDGLGTIGKMVPPIRSRSDRDALWQGCAEGTVDTIGTDNVTMTKAEKKVTSGLVEAIPGYPALATHLSSLIDDGIWCRGLDLIRLVELTSLNPAKLFGLFPRKGVLLPGSDADIVMLDLEAEKPVIPAQLNSRSDFSLYAGRQLKGWPAMTIKGGRVVAEDGYYLGRASGGQVIERRAITGGVK